VLHDLEQEAKEKALLYQRLTVKGYQYISWNLKIFKN